MKFSAHLEEWELTVPFRVSGAEWRTSTGLVVHLSEDGHSGRGEAQGVFYMGETAQSIFAQVHELADTIRGGISREELQNLLPAGGARNAIDCALWDLECKRSGRTIWQLTGIDPKPVTTVFTIGLENTSEAMAAKAAAAADAPILKIKLDGHQPYEKLAAIRAARPDAELVVDANQGWSFELLKEVIPKCVDLGLGMIEQPLARGGDEMLDKTGGLTEALRLARAAKEKGCKLMVGNMVGTSLAMAPSFVVAQLCDLVDIDGPLLLKYDHPLGLEYKQGVVRGIDSRLWG